MVKKLNLSALKNTAEPQINDEVTQETPAIASPVSEETVSTGEKKKGLISLKKSASTSVSQENEAKETTHTDSTSNAQAPVVKTAKVSLRGLKKPEVNSATAIETTQINTTSPENNDSTPNTNEINNTQEIIETPIITDIGVSDEETQKDDIIGKIDSLNGELPQEEVKEEAKKEEVLAIMDGDTNCAIIKDDLDEIFSNFQGSFLEVKEDPKKEEKTVEAKAEAKVEIKNEVIMAKSEILDTKDVVETSNEEVMPDVIETKNEEITTPETSQMVVSEVTAEAPQKTVEVSPTAETTADGVEAKNETTLLQRFSKYKQNKKVIYSGVVSIFLVAVFSFAFLQSSLIKTNVIETQSPEVVTPVVNTDIPVTPTETTEVGTQPENTTGEIETNTNNIENSEIVKENNNNSIDNTANNDRINKRLQNFLLKKYKSK